MKYSRAERQLLADLVDQAGPDAPTLCEGWTTADLVAHLIVREDDPVGALGIVVPPLAAVTRRRMDDLISGNSFPDLVERLRAGPGALSPFRVPGIDEASNLVEFFVHAEDVRRGGTKPPPPRDLPAGMQDALWHRLRRVARMFFRKAKCAVVLERKGTYDRIRIGKGSPIVHLIGEPAELVLYASGRTTVADVEIVGGPDAAADLLGTLGL